MPVNFFDELTWGKQYERTAAQLFADKQWPGSQVAECPARADLDFAVIGPEGGLVAFIEVKTRRIPSTRYTDTILSYKKYEIAALNKRYLQVPTICVIVFTDAFATFDLHKKPDDRKDVTRGDRGSKSDHALYLHSRMAFHPDIAEQMTLPTA